MKGTTMMQAKKLRISGTRRIQPDKPSAGSRSGEPSLLVQRIKELDREFAQQAKQLTSLTKKLSKKLTKRP